MTTKSPTSHDISEALALLHDAHQRLLDSNSYGTDILVYRAIQHLLGEGGDANRPRPTHNTEPPCIADIQMV